MIYCDENQELQTHCYYPKNTINDAKIQYKIRCKKDAKEINSMWNRSTCTASGISAFLVLSNQSFIFT